MAMYLTFKDQYAWTDEKAEWSTEEEKNRKEGTWAICIKHFS